MSGGAVGHPTVSIIIPCYNRRGWIDRAIESSLNQTLNEVEVIVVDDGSTDGSLSIARSFGAKVRCIGLERNVGPSSARNIGLSIAEGEFVLFLDSDDYIIPESVEQFSAASGSADVTFGPFAFEKEGGIFCRKKPKATLCPLEFSYNWACGYFVPPCSVLWRRSFVESIGGWRDAAVRNTDGEIVLRAIVMGARISFAQGGLGIYCQHDSPGRVSRRSGREVLHNQLGIFEALQVLAERRDFGGMQLSIGRLMYGLAVEAFSLDENDIGEHALSRARKLGFCGHAGSWRHRVPARILGLRRTILLFRHISSVNGSLSVKTREHAMR